MKLSKIIMTATSLFASLSLSFSSSATIMKVSYEGIITANKIFSGVGTGYNLGDVISGALFIDTNLVFDSNPNNNLGFYSSGSSSNSSDNVDFVTGLEHPSDTARYASKTSTDEVTFLDNYQGRDYFHITDRQDNLYYDTPEARDNSEATHGESGAFVALGAYSDFGDFISIDSFIQSFTITDFSTDSWGQVYVYNKEYESGYRNNINEGRSSFTLTRLSYNALTYIPEPSSISLFFLAVSALVARQRALKLLTVSH